jgi:hypothetical protein
MTDTPLPEPESKQLAELVGSGSIRLVYGLLHRRQHNPPTSAEIGLFLQAGASADTSAERALRYLRDYFDIATVKAQGEERYQLRGWAGTKPTSGVLPVSSRFRAEILAPARCAMWPHPCTAWCSAQCRSKGPARLGRHELTPRTYSPSSASCLRRLRASGFQPGI